MANFFLRIKRNFMYKLIFCIIFIVFGLKSYTQVLDERVLPITNFNVYDLKSDSITAVSITCFSDYFEDTVNVGNFTFKDSLVQGLSYIPINFSSSNSREILQYHRLQRLVDTPFEIQLDSLNRIMKVTESLEDTIPADFSVFPSWLLLKDLKKHEENKRKKTADATISNTSFKQYAKEIKKQKKFRWLERLFGWNDEELCRSTDSIVSVIENTDLDTIIMNTYFNKKRKVTRYWYEQMNIVRKQLVNENLFIVQRKDSTSEYISRSLLQDNFFNYDSVNQSIGQYKKRFELEDSSIVKQWYFSEGNCIRIIFYADSIIVGKSNYILNKKDEVLAVLDSVFLNEESAYYPLGKVFYHYSDSGLIDSITDVYRWASFEEINSKGYGFYSNLIHRTETYYSNGENKYSPFTKTLNRTDLKNGYYQLSYTFEEQITLNFPHNKKSKDKKKIHRIERVFNDKNQVVSHTLFDVAEEKILISLEYSYLRTL